VSPCDTVCSRVDAGSVDGGGVLVGVTVGSAVAVIVGLRAVGVGVGDADGCMVGRSKAAVGLSIIPASAGGGGLSASIVV